jgi:hypothetical protein
MLEERGKPRTGLLADWDHAMVVGPPAPGSKGIKGKYKHQNHRTVSISCIEIFLKRAFIDMFMSGHLGIHVYSVATKPSNPA